MEVREYIIAEADKLFCQFGFKSVTMDDIAKHLGMSKKTIYRHFSDKDELVTILISEKISTQDCMAKDTAENSENAIDEIFFAINSTNEMLANMNPKLFYDLQKYHPKAWMIFREFKEKTLRETIYRNLERGIKEGLYRDDINTDILTQLRLDQVDLIFSQHDQYTMNKYNLAQIMVELTEHFLYGVCSLTGLGHIYASKLKLKTEAPATTAKI
ncbi:TetR/AcrR family transcriptional regulator [Pedobacter sp. KR3-3]|uniref:TetR/AcrR family transcriptional regulator n=1 Tax=Pedobacter albus TaxID=3113905 RepID=A0ABU7I8R2_9SPHI|nr:TetR/AcrR family transcriptional regulator [Pedobacter sp. KR3-3]MEE1945852.1 TetR/AcrR family transcriptional regulator [Pedobacter sp. KR3-3]